MLRNLLMERFSLVTHSETRRLTSYDLPVAKGGLKMKEAERAPTAVGPPATARDPVPDLPSAAEAQLGLRLQPMKRQGSVVVIDQYSRTPRATEMLPTSAMKPPHG